jgi:2-oxoisovalerate dehydrogenase E2 component (dihydrolipoyl transacylase)
MSFEFPLPDVGEGLTEADIVAWKVAAGDTVTVNQILVEIETAKSLVELPSPQAGTIDALLVDEGQTIEVGTPIIRFGGGDSGAEAGSGSAGSSETGSSESDSGGPAEATATEDADGGATLVGYGARTTSSKRRPRKGDPVPSPSAASAGADSAAASAPAGAASAPAGAAPAAAAASTAATSAAAAASAGQPGAPGAAGGSGGAAKPLAKPPVRKLAKDLGVDLTQVVATGPHGDVTRDDVRGAADQAAAPTSGATETPAASASDQGQVEERIPFKGVTKMMAKAMVDSAFTMPHVTEFLDVDVTETMAMVRRLKSTKFLGEDVKVSPLLIVAKAVAWAVGRNPRINACLDGDEIVVKKYVNLGIAAATPRGLIVPNIKNAHSMGLGELAQRIQDLTALARSGKTPAC